MKVMKPILCTLLLAFSPVAFLWANGGGYTRGGVTETGTITGFVPEETDKVRIMQEDLNVGLTPAEARVEVRYILKNTSGRHLTVRFGFPVEEMKGEDPFIDPAAEQPAKKKGKQRPQLQYCRDYRVEFGGKALQADFEEEPPGDGGDPRRKGLKGWLISKASFSPGEEKTMLIAFRSDWKVEDFSISDDGKRSAKEFKYRLSTGACWDGPIERGRVILRGEGVDPDGVKVLKPAGRFRKVGDQWEWDFEKLKPTLADDFTVQAEPAESYFGGRTISGKFPHEGDKRVYLSEREGRWYARHQNYKASASSTLPPHGDLTYDVMNLVKNSERSVWSAGNSNNGIGEWLELVPDVAKPLHSIQILPGFAETEALFKANARPKSVEVLLNNEFHFTAPLQDQREIQSIPVIGYDKPVDKIRLTFKEAFAGSAYKDLCVSGVWLESRLTKKPNITPAR